MIVAKAHDDSASFLAAIFGFSCSLVKAPDASVCWPEILQYLLFDDVLFRCPTNQSWLTCVESSCFAQVTLPYLLQHLDVSFFPDSGSFQDSGATFSVEYMARKPHVLFSNKTSYSNLHWGSGYLNTKVEASKNWKIGIGVFFWDELYLEVNPNCLVFLGWWILVRSEALLYYPLPSYLGVSERNGHVDLP